MGPKCKAAHSGQGVLRGIPPSPRPLPESRIPTALWAFVAPLLTRERVQPRPETAGATEPARLASKAFSDFSHGLPQNPPGHSPDCSRRLGFPWGPLGLACVVLTDTCTK